jgi:hypothetical protein
MKTSTTTTTTTASVVLMSQDLKTAILRLSANRAIVNTKIAMKYSKRHRDNPETYLWNDYKMVIGSGKQRKQALKACSIPGSKVSEWMMDQPITKYWQPKVERLAKALGLRASEAFDIAEPT